MSAVIGQSGATRAPRNVAEFDELFRQVSNWGLWGKDDQLGSANLVTDAKRDLEAVGEMAAKLKRWEFMLTIAPVPVTGGTGFRVNALATF
jgi:hypothetical protein